MTQNRTQKAHDSCQHNNGKPFHEHFFHSSQWKIAKNVPVHPYVIPDRYSGAYPVPRRWRCMHVFPFHTHALRVYLDSKKKATIRIFRNERYRPFADQRTVADLWLRSEPSQIFVYDLLWCLGGCETIDRKIESYRRRECMTIVFVLRTLLDTWDGPNSIGWPKVFFILAQYHFYPFFLKIRNFLSFTGYRKPHH